ncbi:MAG: ThiF family adenylyltransferase [Gemmatimonadales bacterium]|jgi:molybdopterin/thiamine biosynthesis adenylyltransferase
MKKTGGAASEVVVVGLGNIGSCLAGYLARLQAIRKITVVDHDVYELPNLESQDIAAREIGRSKAAVVARRLRAIDPELEVTPLARRVETVPRGLLRADVILAALDSKAARVSVNEIAWRLGVPFVDAGVEPTGGLARIAVYLPGPKAPCYECALCDADYENLEQVHWCTGEAAAAATNAPAYLGALAASLAAAECEKLLSGRLSESLAGREVVVSARHQTHFVTRYRRNERCRFDHRVWTIETLDARADRFSVEQLRALGNGSGDAAALQLRVEGQRFHTRLRCSACGETYEVLQLSRWPIARRCQRCGGSLIPLGFYSYDRLDLAALPTSTTRRSLQSVGLRDGDVFSLTSGEHERHFELGD